jgi:hypothetical protein
MTVGFNPRKMKSVLEHLNPVELNKLSINVLPKSMTFVREHNHRIAGNMPLELQVHRCLPHCSLNGNVHGTSS